MLWLALPRADDEQRLNRSISIARGNQEYAGGQGARAHHIAQNSRAKQARLLRFQDLSQLQWPYALLRNFELKIR